MLALSKYVLIILSLVLIIRCIRSMLSDRYEPEIWAYLRYGETTYTLTHWETIIGRSLNADVRVVSPGVGRVHAVLRRNDKGRWRVYDIFSKGGVWIKSVKAGPEGLPVENGDVINVGGEKLRFREVTLSKREKLESKRTVAGLGISPAVTLLELTVFQLCLLLQHYFSAEGDTLRAIALAFVALIALEWICYNAMRVINRSGFEIETLAFYLTSIGMSVVASSAPEDMFKQILLTIAAVVLFVLLGWWLRKLDRAMSARFSVAVISVLLMLVNIVFSDALLGARNWLNFAGFSFQPSELVKVGYIYVGASTLDKLFRRRNLYMFILFSTFCVVSLALIGDFGTAFIFFVTFLVISFLRSGSVATVLLAVTGAGLAGFLAVSVRPYIARRFSTWGHVWDDVYGAGFQQSRAMSAAASGGLYGKGAGGGWLKDIFAANTDMVFAMVCEEQGLIIGVIMVLAVLVLAFFAVRTARQGRSAYYSIAACAAMSMLLVQLGMNVFGSLDILPFTGVTFPFVSKGGTSLLSCWMLMAFIKSADNRRDASFAVRSAAQDEPDDGEDEDLSSWEVWQPRKK
ncbi:MAG: FtsW/RodA/SpoVE family cell cycle protein [Oscillospiraceae bacterium]|nr:FtsW/RodA/SpoVE family cell cycle protein [Oscillospiraceae bacterium]